MGNDTASAESAAAFLSSLFYFRRFRFYFFLTGNSIVTPFVKIKISAPAGMPGERYETYAAYFLCGILLCGTPLIAEAPDGKDVLGIGRLVFYLHADTADVYIDYLVVAVIAFAPDVVEDA